MHAGDHIRGLDWCTGRGREWWNFGWHWTRKDIVPVLFKMYVGKWTNILNKSWVEYNYDAVISWKHRIVKLDYEIFTSQLPSPQHSLSYGYLLLTMFLEIMLLKCKIKVLFISELYKLHNNSSWQPSLVLKCNFKVKVSRVLCSIWSSNEDICLQICNMFGLGLSGVHRVLK